MVALGDPASELLHLSRTAHLLVVGSRGHGVSRSIPTGQIGTWLAHRTACPVVVVPDFNPETVRQGVLVGVPTAPHALDVLDFACHYASVHDLPLSVVHATKGAPGTDDDRRRWLAEAMGGLAERFPDVRINAVLLPGRPGRDAAAHGRADASPGRRTASPRRSAPVAVRPRPQQHRGPVALSHRRRARIASPSRPDRAGRR